MLPEAESVARLILLISLYIDRIVPRARSVEQCYRAALEADGTRVLSEIRFVLYNWTAKGG